MPSGRLVAHAGLSAGGQAEYFPALIFAMLQALKLQLALRSASTEHMRAADVKAASAHLHVEDDAP